MDKRSSKPTSEELAREKQELENKKLRKEIDQLSRPSYLRPANWVSATAAVVAVTGIAFQYFASKHEFRVAEINAKKAEVTKQEAEFATIKARDKVETIQRELTEKTDELDSSREEERRLQEAKLLLDEEIATKKTDLRNLLSAADEYANDPSSENHEQLKNLATKLGVVLDRDDKVLARMRDVAKSGMTLMDLKDDVVGSFTDDERSHAKRRWNVLILEFLGSGQFGLEGGKLAKLKE